jgi:hypothetical protein
MPTTEHLFMAELYENTAQSPSIFRRFAGGRELLAGE